MSGKMQWHKSLKFKTGVIITDHRREGEFKDLADRWLDKNDPKRNPNLKKEHQNDRKKEKSIDRSK